MSCKKAMTEAVPILCHGTTTHRARRILATDFRRGKSASYTGTAVNLSESICLAWEYGPPTWRKTIGGHAGRPTRWRDAEKFPVGQRYDTHFASGQFDALRTYGGNIWLLWTTERAQVRVLSIREIMTRIIAEFKSDGPDCGHNGDLWPLSTLFWYGEAATYAELRICAPKHFDVEAWKDRTIRRYKSLLSFSGVQPGAGKAQP